MLCTRRTLCFILLTIGALLCYQRMASVQPGVTFDLESILTSDWADDIEQRRQARFILESEESEMNESFRSVNGYRPFVSLPQT